MIECSPFCLEDGFMAVGWRRELENVCVFSNDVSERALMVAVPDCNDVKNKRQFINSCSASVEA